MCAQVVALNSPCIGHEGRTMLSLRCTAVSTFSVQVFSLTITEDVELILGVCGWFVTAAMSLKATTSPNLISPDCSLRMSSCMLDTCAALSINLRGRDVVVIDVRSTRFSARHLLVYNFASITESLGG
jgi:hypothetical protein